VPPTPVFRPATHGDAQFAAAVTEAVETHRPRAAEDLLEMWINTEKGADVRRFVVEEDGVDRGWISLVKPREAGGQAVYLNLLVPAAFKQLLPAAVVFGESQARQMDAPLLICEIGEDQEAAVDHLRSSGWTQERQLRFWQLALGPNADRIRAMRPEARRKLEASGVAVTTLAELGGPPFLRRLHVVGQAASADIPSSVEYVPEPYEEWAAWMQPPAVLPERIWVAVVDGQPVGYSYLAYRVSIVETGFTGVLREHRGKGIARALKLETLVQAIDLGTESVQTDNDSENAPILHLNEELGYDEIPGKLEFHRKLV
jgi:GNAT superfamily N-acetyltransferase